MPRRKRSQSPFEYFDSAFDEDSSSCNSRNETGVPRNAANARERARMRVLSSAFSKLKTKLPNIPADTKLSKLDTLRLATIYIKQLKGLVEGDQSSTEEVPVKFNHSQNSLTWPFTYQNIQNYRQAQMHSYTPKSNISLQQPTHISAAVTGYTTASLSPSIDWSDRYQHHNSEKPPPMFNNNNNNVYNYHYEDYNHEQY
ncbi:MSC family protein [Megaselia abdita]